MKSLGHYNHPLFFSLILNKLIHLPPKKELLGSNVYELELLVNLGCNFYIMGSSNS
jgi:hypothetical protein